MHKSFYSFLRVALSVLMIVTFTLGSFPIGAIKVFADEVTVETSAEQAPVVTEAPVVNEAPAEVTQPVVDTAATETTTEVTPEVTETNKADTVIPESTPAEESKTDVVAPTESTENIVSKDAPVPVTLGDIINTVADNVDSALNSLTYENISPETRYSSNDGNFGVVFKQLPEGTHNVTIKKITLTPAEVEATGALSATAYDVTSDMADRTFTYDLSMPVPDNTEAGDVTVKYAETRDELPAAVAIAPADVTVNDGTVTAEDVNHFTIFLVTSGTNTNNAGVGTPLDASQIASLQASDNSRLNKGWGNNFGQRSQEFVFGAAYPSNSSILSATVRIEIRRDANIDTAQLEYWDGSAYDTTNPENILPANNGVDQTFTFSVPTNYINTPAKINAFKVRVRASGTPACPTACSTDIDFLRLQVVTGDRATNTFPADQANVSTAAAGFTYTWTAVPYATTYEFERCTINPGANDCAVAGGTVIDSATGLPGPSYLVGAGYAEALNSYWHVRTIFNDGEVSPWSDAFRLTIDNTVPVIIVAYSPASPDGTNGWYKQDVGVDFTCTDALSGVASGVDGNDTTLTNELANQVTSSGTCTDLAGNVAASIDTVPISIDKTAPVITEGTITGTLGLNGWYTTDVTVDYSATDNVSGFDALNTLSSAMASKTTSGEGLALTVTSDPITDWAGNTATGITSGPFKVDLNDPVISLTSRTAANANDWNNTDVTIVWSCSDTMSGAVVDPITNIVSTQGVGQTSTATCVDNSGRSGAGSTDTQTGINIDKTAPVIAEGAITGTGPNAAGWYRSNVTVDYSATDNLSGFMPITVAPVGTLSSAMASKTTSGEGDDRYVTSDTITDLADNTATAVTSGPFKVDLTNPNLSITGPANDAHVSSTFTVSGTASDPISDIKRVRVQFRDEVTNALVVAYNATYSAGSWTLDVSPSTNPVADGYYRIRVVATDNADRTRTRINRRVRVDSVAPVITILGSNPATHEALTTYTDAGATSLDNIDGDITAGIVTTNNVNQNVIGTYTVDYSSTDSAGNNSTASRTVNVVDTTIPVITLLGADPVTIEVHTPYTDAGATALDNYDGDVTASIVTVNPVNKDVVADYVVTYNVADSSGNNAVQVTRTVHVVDTTAPVITLNGGDMTITAPTSYTEPGYSAIDNYDGDITGNVVVTGTVNTNVAGTYTLSYNVTDAHGNVATTRTRTVTVNPSQNGPIDGTAPSTGFVPGAQGGSSGGGGGGGSVLGAFTGPNGSFFGGGFSPFQQLTGALESPKLGTANLGGGTVLGASKFIFTKNLRQGMKISDVSELQKRLIAEGFLTADNATGFYGAKTVAAVKAYQKKHGILVTGSVGPLTRAELNK